MNKTTYNPKVFEQENIENAKKIILTKEDNLETDERWEKETPFLVEEIINKLKEYQGNYVKVTYVERYATFSWLGDTKYFITEVTKEKSPHVRN